MKTTAAALGALLVLAAAAAAAAAAVMTEDEEVAAAVREAGAMEAMAAEEEAVAPNAALSVAGRGAVAGRRGGWGEPGCPMHRLGHLNGVLGVTSGAPALRPLLHVDLAAAHAARSGCSVLDATAARLVLPDVKLKLYYGEGEDDNVAAPVTSGASLMDDARWDSSRCIAVYAFGYTSFPNNEYTRAAVSALVSTGQYNVLLVDWSAANNFSYELTVDLIDHVAQPVAQALQRMVQRGARLCLVAGHSLGGQMTGYISRHVKRLGGSVPCAVALDPAAPLFEGRYYGCAQRLARGDADWVVVLHSDVCGLGSAATRGDVDFFPNGGGHEQPNCPGDYYDRVGTPVGACSHVRAVLVFAEALRRPGAFPARQCASWERFRAGACDHNAVLHFPQCARGSPGSYYMITTGDDPLQSTNPPAN